MKKLLWLYLSFCLILIGIIAGSDLALYVRFGQGSYDYLISNLFPISIEAVLVIYLLFMIWQTTRKIRLPDLDDLPGVIFARKQLRVGMIISFVSLITPVSVVYCLERQNIQSLAISAIDMDALLLSAVFAGVILALNSVYVLILGTKTDL